MRTPWKHSLAALALAAVLGPCAGPSAAGDPPAAPGPETKPVPAAAPEKAPPAAKGDAALKQLQDAQQEIANELERLTQERDRLTERERTYGRVLTSSDPRLAKLRDQIEDLKKTIADAEAKKAKLEGELKATEAKQAEVNAPHIKVFHLKHTEPGEMANLLTALLPGEQPANWAGPGTPGGAMMRGGRAGMGRGMAMPGAGPMMGMGSPGPAPARLRVAVDHRTHCLIARGSEADLQTAADLIDMLDQADGKPAPRVKNLRAYRLHYARPTDVEGIVQNLGIGVRVAALSGARVLVVSGPESAQKEVAEVIEALDVSGPPTTKGGGPGGKR